MGRSLSCSFPGFVSDLEYQWEHPWSSRFLERLGSFARLIRFDKRGTGLSERIERAAALGDRKCRDVLGAYYAVARRELRRFRGRELDTGGDGFFAAFDGPARAVRCAQAINDGARLVGVDVRAGLHPGECEVVGEKLGGIAVHIGARIAALAGAGEVLVSNTVKDLVAGSGLSFEGRGQHILKGVPGEWSVYAVSPAF